MSRLFALSKWTDKLHDGTVANTMTYNMEGLLRLSVEKCLDLVGKDTKLKRVSPQACQRRPRISNQGHQLRGTKKRQQIAHGAHVNLIQDRQLPCSLIPLLPGRKQLKSNEVPWPFMQLAS